MGTGFTYLLYLGIVLASGLVLLCAVDTCVWLYCRGRILLYQENDEGIEEGVIADVYL
jgi:hypothetical protein